MSEREIPYEAWMKASNLQELGDLTVRWLERKIKWHFSQLAEPNPETSEILDYLIQINSLGLVTEFSQPAKPLKNGCGQRACVSGFSNEDIAKKLAILNLYTDLIVLIFEPGWLFSKKSYGYEIPVTVVDYHPYTWCGSVTGYEIESYEGLLSDEAIIALTESWHIIAIDTKWGRRPYLWNNLIKILSGGIDSVNKYSIEPYPGHELDVDFVY
jgi:hypothetical protein